MPYYLEKVTFTGTASSSKRWLTATSTKAYSGYIAGLYYSTDATNPLTAGSSSIIYLRSGSTTGRILCRSSSGFVGVARWKFPVWPASRSTQLDKTWGSSGESAMRVPIAREKLVMVKVAGATSGGGGSTEGLSLTIYIEGVNP